MVKATKKKPKPKPKLTIGDLSEKVNDSTRVNIRLGLFIEAMMSTLPSNAKDEAGLLIKEIILSQKE